MDDQGKQTKMSALLVAINSLISAIQAETDRDTLILLAIEARDLVQDAPNIQIIAAINDFIDHVEQGDEYDALEQLALAIKALVEASGG